MFFSKIKKFKALNLKLVKKNECRFYNPENLT